MVKIGYNSNGFAHHRLEEAIPMLAELGYQAVAITPDVGCLDPKGTRLVEVTRIGNLCADLGIAVVVETGARFLLDPKRKHRPNLLEPDESHQVRLNFLRRMLEWSDALGAGVMSFWSGVMPEGQTEQGAAQRLADASYKLKLVAERYGVTLALEPEPGHWIATLDDYRQFRDEHPKLFKLTLDVGHLLVTREAEPHDAIREWKSEIVNLQLDDMKPRKHVHLPPGEGKLDWQALAEAVKKARLRVPACFELSRDSHRFDQLAPTVIDFWTKLHKRRTVSA